jgi:hypothetical protein
MTGAFTRVEFAAHLRRTEDREGEAPNQVKASHPVEGDQGASVDNQEVSHRE